MVWIKVVNVLSADNIYLGVPIAIERIKGVKLRLLLFRQIRKVAEYEFVIHDSDVAGDDCGASLLFALGLRR